MATESPADRLARVLRVPTAATDGVPDAAGLRTLRDLLVELYPGAFAALEVELVAEHTILARWPGASRDEPALLMAHQDVVPPGDGWTHGPFDGAIVDGVVWGRGAIDDKGSLVGILEAIEALVGEGFAPARDVWLVLGHDEETLGGGARAAVEALATRGVAFAFALDEGGAVVDPPVPGVAVPAAMVGTSERGVAMLRLAVDEHGGHASTPPRMPATAILARAVVRASRARFPERLTPTTVRMLRTLGAHAREPYRALLTRADVLSPVLRRIMAANPETRATITTTASVTRLRAGTAANAIAERAEATVNVRLAQGTSIADVVRILRRAIRDERVAIDVVHGHEASPTSPTDGRGWDAIVAATAREHPGAVLSPYVMLGASDGRHAHRVTDRVYRFTPFVLTSELRACLHARDERIPVEAFERGVRWYRRLLEAC
ncbi:M20/M25/M40 family metallo-hydrolase [Agrococcus sp. SGAir0287]|uniref:M20/M25/M40 family metallo-hydrolase n=1 Tax=Agrococcus sp. SGAir0287 TaxID=2070347 RepID=UPI00158691F4|nr:M20/M25/M40 family metallo-hydrolase [Agrococcus sp. SGAir0287]